MSYIARMTRDEKFSMRLPAELKAELQRRADAEARSLGAYVVLALQQHVATAPTSAVHVSAAKPSRAKAKA